MTNSPYRVLTLAACVVTFVGLAGRADAHHRDFTFLRDWFLPYAGENEIESRTSYIDSMRSFSQEFEYEYGVSEHFAIEPGIEFHQQTGEDLHLEGWDTELRFNFGEFAYNQILPALNVEYEDPSARGEPSRGELKFISSYFTPAGENYSVNFNIGQELSGPKEKESEVLFGYARGLGSARESSVGYQTGWRGGFESMFDFNEHFLAAGPVVIYRVEKDFNALATVMFPLNKTDQQHTALKLIMEWEF